MHIPLEIIARIVEQVDRLGDLDDTLALRLTSHTMNHEVLKALLRSDELYPRNTEKLLELNRVKLCPQIITHEVVQWRKRHAKSDDDTGLLPPRGRTCFMGIPGNYRSSWDDPDPRPLPASLLRQYLIARMERADESPCLLSVLIGKSVDLVMGGDIEVGCQTRQKLFNDMIASFNTDLIGLPIADKIFSTLFNSHGLDHWLPIYESAHLTVYPSPEYSLRLLHLLRIVQISIHLRDYEETSDPNEMIIDLLEDPPAGPEYARLFAIDAFNIIAKANDTELMATFLASNTSRSLGGLSVAERVWCAAKQDKHDLVHILVSKALVQNGVLAKDIDRLAYEMILIIEGMVGSGADTHFGRSVIEDLVKCKDVWSVEEIRKEMGNPQT